MTKTTCPCETCAERRYYAKMLGMQIYGEDCPYVCPAYETWKDEGGSEDETEQFSC